MAKTATAVAPVATGGLPVEFEDLLEKDAGKGYENVTQADKLIPFITIAQALSPQLNERESSFIPGLKQGDFFSAATGKVWPGKTGFTFVPVLYQHKYLEWVPREKGGGFAGEHGPEIMSKVHREERGGRFANWLDSGNTIVETATWYGIIIDRDTGDAEQAVLALSSTQFKKSKQLHNKLDQVLRTRKDGTKYRPSMWYNAVDMTTVPESNDKGSWFSWNPKLAGNVFELPGGKELYLAGEPFKEAVQAGEIKTAAPQDGSIDGEVVDKSAF